MRLLIKVGIFPSMNVVNCITTCTSCIHIWIDGMHGLLTYMFTSHRAK